ncbi:hypothetical protein MA16_Dca015847 [Dendrobium catenatum]|uniref:TITAN-like protein n=1 Tax=Dendrobium catenatum TaxID=906689 RepID=A0A2I0X0J8_9ASPA|nr:hypothetical protein MA16_Dca015847 [Dendrobium catenatum]
MTKLQKAKASMRPLAKKKGESGGESFEFCEVCNLNHDQGRRHRYFPKHSRTLANTLSRFQNKLSELQFFIRNPSFLRSEHAALNRIWCVFCALDISEIGDYFVCGNAIRHLASELHFWNLKRYLWKHGGGIDRVDLFRVSEADLLKWEKGCEALKNVASSSSEGPIGPVLGPSKDIQFKHELNSNKMDSFNNHSISSFSSNVSHPVLPLQIYTNENYGVCHPNDNGSATAAHVDKDSIPLSLGLRGNVSLDHMGGLESVDRHLTGVECKRVDFKGKRGHVETVVYNIGTDYRESNGALQMLTPIALPSEGSPANVHTGGLPPWLDMCDEREKSLLNFGAHMNNHAPLAHKGKSKKLNPKRVGAAWAEKRRIELEMEKTGEIVKDSVDANWLPNFGRVWQAGTRKESRKEFERENKKMFKDVLHSEASSMLQPYISKRMRMGSSSKVEAAEPFIEQQ